MDVTIQIVILAMIAAFLGLRLYSVLGRRAEHEEEPIRGRFDEKTGLPGAVPPAAPRIAGVQQAGDSRVELGAGLPAVERGLRDIAAADRRFDPASFLEGARGAYRMVLEAYWRGDVFEGFAGAIDTRSAAGEVLDNRLIRIDDVAIVAASFVAPMARVSVRFAADIAAVTRDAAGNVIAGSLDDGIESRDVWTFSRNVSSADPDWLLDETDEG
jgi:predicted lipid-binding transport protein (Tim44 family)